MTSEQFAELEKELEMLDEKEKREIKSFISRRGLDMYMYDFADKYRSLQIDIFYDNDGDKFTYINGKKIYLNNSFDEQKFRVCIWLIHLEQDVRSPHCYLQNEKRMPTNDMVVAEFGAAEGSFALSVIDKIKKLYLFEYEDEWIRALQKTFAPYKDKVVIVKAYVSNKNSNMNGINTVTLDTFFAGRQIDYIKADIEGAEVEMLQGGEETLKNKVKKVLCCAYHKNRDYEKISELLSNYGFKYEHNEGWILPATIIYGQENDVPFLRRGVVYGWK